MEKQTVGIFEVALPHGCSTDQQTITELLKYFLNTINRSKDFTADYPEAVVWRSVPHRWQNLIL